MSQPSVPPQHPRLGVALRASALAVIALVLGLASILQPSRALEPNALVIPASHPDGVQEHMERAADEVSTITDEVLDWAEALLGEVRDAVGSPTADAQRVVAETVGIRLLAPIATDAQSNDSGADAGDGSTLDWQRLSAAAATPERIVLLVHGLDEPGDIWDELAPAIREQGLRVARFDYPNDQGIADSTDMLASALADLRARGTIRIDLVCHSMGGLVARDLLTREAYYAGHANASETMPRIERVITVGTPNYGAPLAPLRGLAEVRDQLTRLVDNDDITLGDLLRFTSDGNGEAGIDLAPGSEFLTALNDRPFPVGARWTILIGRIATPEDVHALTDSKVARAMGIDDDLDELIRTLAPLTDDFGDGAVPASSAPLPGVEDTVYLVGNHRSMLRTIPIEQSVRKVLGEAPPEIPPAIPVILERLRTPVEQPVSGSAED